MIGKFSSLNKKGITLTSLTIYVIVATVVVGILVFLNANFFSNINDLTEKANIVGECLDFKSAFLRDIKSENEVKVTDYNNHMIRFSNNVKYEIRVLDKAATQKKFAIYRNDVQIAKSIVSHTDIDGKEAKEGPYFEYDVASNTIKVGMKFSDGENVYLENQTYKVGKNTDRVSLDNNFNDSWGILDDEDNIISGDDGEIDEPDNPGTGDDINDNTEMPESEKLYAIIYRVSESSPIAFQISPEPITLDSGTLIKLYENMTLSEIYSDADWIRYKDEIKTLSFEKDSNGEKIQLTSMNNLFAGCTGITTISGLENLDISNVTSAENAFKDCVNLTSVNLKNLDTSNLENISGMFDGCTSLTSVELNAVNLGKVEDMSNMFNNCSSIQSIDLNALSVTPENLTDMSNMFANCTSLSNLNISNLNLNNVTNISRMFYNCQNLGHIAIGTITSQEITDLSYLFYNCKKLSAVNIGNIDTSNVTDVSYMFANCEIFNNPTFPFSDTSSIKNMEGMYLNCSSANQIQLGNLKPVNVTNMSRMFEGCTKLTGFNGMDSFTTASVTNMSAMFKNCTSLNNIYLEYTNFDTSSVKNMSEMFNGCTAANQINIKTFDTSFVSDFSSMFENCSNLTSLDLKNFDTFNATNMSKMFMNATNLGTITVSDSWNSDYTNVNQDDMLTGCLANSLSKQ